MPSKNENISKRNLKITPTVKDLIFMAIGAVALAVFLGLTKIHVIEKFINFYQTFTYAWELEELIVLSLFLILSFAIFAWRRWRELRIEIVECIRLEHEVSESQRTLAILISNLPGMAYRCRIDKDYTMEFVSDYSYELTGYSSEHLTLNNRISYRQIIHSEDRDSVLDQIQDALKDHKPFQLTYRINTATGQEKWVSEQGREIYSPSGEVLTLEGIVIDITERRRMRELERVRQEQLAQADKMITLGTLVSGVAHEINNPANFITLNAPILREAWHGFMPILEDHYEKEGDFFVGRYKYSAIKGNIELLFDGIDEGAERIKNIVLDLKDFARPDPSDMNQSIDINKVILSSFSLLKNPIHKRTKHFHMKLGSNLPPIIGSFQKLEQVVINLIQNACESLADNEKAVAIFSEFDENRSRVLIKIKDEGCGISKEMLSHLFDPFFTTKRTLGGVGLGLSITAKIIKDHSGALGFESVLGKGTTVTVTLPVNGCIVEK
jgi:PAS domain S-box-containing protein